MARLGMIADDLTGACDAGVQFAERGISTVVALVPEAVDDSADMLVVSTDSREMTPEEARERVARACERLTACGRTVIFKKIDSTLRGNLGPEIDAALDALRFDRAFLAPAFPAMGRTVEGRWLCVDGERIRELPDVPRTVAFDARTQADLAEVARAARAGRALPVGSGGLAREVAGLVAPIPPAPLETGRRRGPLAIIAGSTNAVTLAQVGYLKAHRPPETYRLVPARAAAESVRGAGALLITGGYTAAQYCRAAGARAIRLERQVLDGIPCGTLMGGPLDGATVITKAGGFGSEDALARIADLFGRPPFE